MLANVCQVQHIEGTIQLSTVIFQLHYYKPALTRASTGIGAGSEGECFWSQSITALAAPVKWDVIQFNEGTVSWYGGPMGTNAGRNCQYVCIQACIRCGLVSTHRTSCNNGHGRQEFLVTVFLFVILFIDVWLHGPVLPHSLVRELHVDVAAHWGTTHLRNHDAVYAGKVSQSTWYTTEWSEQLTLTFVIHSYSLVPVISRPFSSYLRSRLFLCVPDVEIKNKVAVETVQALGVSHINDLYSVVTGHCGKVKT